MCLCDFYRKQCAWPVWPQTLMRYYTFTLSFLVEPIVSYIQTVAPTCLHLGGGGGEGEGLAKYGHILNSARILANAEIYGRSIN